MQDPGFSLEHIQSIVHMLASLLSMKGDYSKESMKLPPALENVIPDLIVKFADGARIHSGRRLCSRAVRHSVDPSGPNIMNGQLKICKLSLSEQMVFILSHKVKASMRKDIYLTQVAFSADDLIACQCTCRCGAEKDEYILCVHPPVSQSRSFALRRHS